MMRAVTKMPGNCAYFSPVVVAAAIAQLEVNELMLIILYLASPLPHLMTVAGGQVAIGMHCSTFILKCIFTQKKLYFL